MGHSNAPEAASTVPVRLGWLHASNVWLVARQEKVLRVNHTTPLKKCWKSFKLCCSCHPKEKDRPKRPAHLVWVRQILHFLGLQTTTASDLGRESVSKCHSPAGLYYRNRNEQYEVRDGYPRGALSWIQSSTVRHFEQRNLREHCLSYNTSQYRQ